MADNRYGESRNMWRREQPGRSRSSIFGGPYGPQHGYGGFQGDYRGGSAQDGFGGQGDYRHGRESLSPHRYDLGAGAERTGSLLDDQYRDWRDRQLAELDRDYEEYCREKQQRFHSDFEGWRRGRRASLQQQEDHQPPINTAAGPTAGSEAAGDRAEKRKTGDRRRRAAASSKS